MTLKALHVSISDKCIANCDYCSFRDHNKRKYPRHVLIPLILGSVHKNTLKTIVTRQENDFLRRLDEISPVIMYVEYLRKNGKNLEDVDSWDPCFCCYKMRYDKKFMKSFKISSKMRIERKMTIKKWKEVILDGKKLGIKDIIFDGEGEPFLEFEKLYILIGYANKKFDNIVVYTNASFVNNKENARKKMKLLAEAGLTHLFISCDYNPKYKFHQFFIPEEKVIVLSDVTKELNIPTNFACNMLKGDDSRKILFRLENMTGRKLKMVSLNPSLLREMTHWPKKLKFVFSLFTKKKYANFVHMDYVRINPRVEKKIDSELIWKYKPLNFIFLLKLYLVGKKLTSHYSKFCQDSIFVTSNGTVLKCSSEAF